MDPERDCSFKMNYEYLRPQLHRMQLQLLCYVTGSATELNRTTPPGARLFVRHSSTKQPDSENKLCLSEHDQKIEAPK